MTTLTQIITKYGKPLNYGYPAKKFTEKEIYQIIKEWLKQFGCKIPCEKCFLSLQCPYPKILRDLKK